MSLFLSTYNNKIDKKGRVSIPSQFRSVISSEGSDVVIIYKSVVRNCLEGCAFSRIEKMHEAIEEFDPFSDVKDAFATSILGASHQISFDSEGRIVLPKKLMEEVKLEENAIFIGKGKIFEIWNPDNFEEHIEKSKVIAMKEREQLKITNKKQNND